MPGEKIATAIYLYRLGNLGGGAERMVCMLANALSERGLSVQIVTWDDPNASSYYALDNGVKWHRLGFRSGLLDKFRRTFTLAKVLHRQGVRVLVGFVMSGDKTVYAAAKLARVRLVAAERNAPSMYKLRYSTLQRQQYFSLLRLVDRIVVQFPEYTKGYPLALRGRIEVIPNPVLPAHRTAVPAKPNADGRYTLLAVSRMDPVQKRLACLVEAFAKAAVKHIEWDLQIIGDGPEKGALIDRIAESGLGGRVRISDPVPEILDLYSKAHLFTIPSLWEGFPNALAEAMASGLPAVGFAGAEGVAHLIDNGETGWLADGLDNADTLADALESAMKDHAERSRRGANAVQAMAAYLPEAQFAKWRKLIESLLADR